MTFLLPLLLVACSIDYTIWMPRSQTADPLYRFVQNHKAGYIDRSGSVVLKPRFRSDSNSGFEFHEGLLAHDRGRYSRVNGTTYSIPGLRTSGDFAEGLAAAAKDQLFGFMDPWGKFAIAPQFQSAADFSEGLALVRSNGRYGYIDRSGRYIIQPKFAYADSFRDGFALVIEEGACVYFAEGGCGGPVPVGQSGYESNEPCKLFFIDKRGNSLTNLRFTGAHGFSEGLAPVQVDELWGFLDHSGALAIPPTFPSAGSFHSGLARVGFRPGPNRGLLYGFADPSGNLAIPATFTYAEDFSDGFAVVGKSSTELWYIDQTGKQAFPGTFTAASGFFKGLAHVQMEPNGNQSQRLRQAYIDAKGKPVFQYLSDQRNFYP